MQVKLILHVLNCYILERGEMPNNNNATKEDVYESIDEISKKKLYVNQTHCLHSSVGLQLLPTATVPIKTLLNSQTAILSQNGLQRRDSLDDYEGYTYHSDSDNESSSGYEDVVESNFTSLNVAAGAFPSLTNLSKDVLIQENMSTVYTSV